MSCNKDKGESLTDGGRAGRSTTMTGFQCGLLLAMAAAIVLRLGVILVLQTYAGDSGAYEHATIAESLARGEGFRFNFYSDRAFPSSHQAPAVPGLLSLCFLLAGIGTPGAYLLMELINVGLAALGLWALGQVGRLMWNERVGVISAWLGAVYPPLVYAVTRVQAVNWSVNFFLLGIYCVILLQERRSSGMAATLGVCLGLGALGEPILLAPTVAVLSLLFLVREWRLSGVAVAALALTLAPWLVRNMVVHSQLVLVKSTFWYVFWQGNNMQATGTDKVEVSPEVVRALSWRVSLNGLEEQLNKAKEQVESVDTFISPEAVQEIMRQPREIDKMGWFRKESLRILQEHQGHYLLMCGKRAWKFLWFDTTNPRSLVLAYRLPYLLLLVLAGVGVVVSVWEPPRFWIVPVIMCVALMAVHVLVITSARFRLPMEAVLLLPAAATVSRGIGAGRPRRQ